VGMDWRPRFQSKFYRQGIALLQWTDYRPHKKVEFSDTPSVFLGEFGGCKGRDPADLFYLQHVDEVGNVLLYRTQKDHYVFVSYGPQDITPETREVRRSNLAIDRRAKKWAKWRSWFPRHEDAAAWERD